MSVLTSTQMYCRVQCTVLFECTLVQIGVEETLHCTVLDSQWPVYTTNVTVWIAVNNKVQYSAAQSIQRVEWCILSVFCDTVPCMIPPRWFLPLHQPPGDDLTWPLSPTYLFWSGESVAAPAAGTSWPRLAPPSSERSWRPLTLDGTGCNFLYPISYVN